MLVNKAPVASKGVSENRCAVSPYGCSGTVLVQYALISRHILCEFLLALGYFLHAATSTAESKPWNGNYRSRIM